MHISGITTIVYALLVFIGGLIGFLKAHSKVSLFAGIIFGLALAITGIGVFKGCKIAYYSALSLTALLAAFFAYRFLLSYAFMPAGLMVVLSVIVFGVLITRRP